MQRLAITFLDRSKCKYPPSLNGSAGILNYHEIVLIFIVDGAYAQFRSFSLYFSIAENACSYGSIIYERFKA